MSEERIVVWVDPDLEGLIPGFLENRRKDARAIRQAVARGDLEEIRIIGHTMKGSGGGYGFDALSDLGAALEAGAKGLEPQAISRVVAQLEDYLDRLAVVYD